MRALAKNDWLFSRVAASFGVKRTKVGAERSCVTASANWVASAGVSNRSEPVPALAARPSLIGQAPAGSASSIFRGMVWSPLQGHPAPLWGKQNRTPDGKKLPGGFSEKIFSGGGARADPNGRHSP